MKLSMLLKAYGFDLNQRIKIVRHSDKKRGYDLPLLHQKGQLEIYQSYQEDPDFRDCDYLISFLGTTKTYAKFIGVYQVQGVKPAKEVPLPEDFHHYDIFKPNRNYYYILERVQLFDEWRDRLVIDWGKGTINWNQKFPKNDKDVIEFLPKGYVNHFPGYLDFILTHEELKKVVDFPDAHHDWHRMLSAVAGVYVILDTTNGKQYIGSASGMVGIMGRFRSYAKNGHGENVELKKLVNLDPSYAQHFQYTLLETLPLSMTGAEVREREILYKKKLWSREHGLNRN